MTSHPLMYSTAILAQVNLFLCSLMRIPRFLRTLRRILRTLMRILCFLCTLMRILRKNLETVVPPIHVLLITDRRHQNVVRTSATHSPINRLMSHFILYKVEINMVCLPFQEQKQLYHLLVSLMPSQQLLPFQVQNILFLYQGCRSAQGVQLYINTFCQQTIRHTHCICIRKDLSQKKEIS